MAIMVGDTINTPEGRSEITEILTERVNQHVLFLIYFFANGVTARVKWFTNRCHMAQAMNHEANMVFKPSEPEDAWYKDDYDGDCHCEGEECWC